MLVLSRKLGERILIPQFELTFSMVAIDGNTVKLGITAPSNVGVYREELWRKVRMEQGRTGSCSRGPRDALSLLALRHSFAMGKLRPRLADRGASPNNLQAA